MKTTNETTNEKARRRLKKQIKLLRGLEYEPEKWEIYEGDVPEKTETEKKIELERRKAYYLGSIEKMELENKEEEMNIIEIELMKERAKEFESLRYRVFETFNLREDFVGTFRKEYVEKCIKKYRKMVLDWVILSYQQQNMMCATWDGIIQVYNGFREIFDTICSDFDD